jgi:hypothetical protein
MGTAGAFPGIKLPGSGVNNILSIGNLLTYLRI